MTQRPITADDLLAHGPLRRIGRRIYTLPEIDSTNSFLLREPDAPDGAIAHAELQRAGRGRLGRSWQAPRGSSLLLSVLLIEPLETPLLATASILGAVAARDAVAHDTDCAPAIRWPNDLTIRGRKVGGVLVESAPTSAAARRIVIGIGLNCLQQLGHFPEDLAPRATSLEIESRQPIYRERLAGALVRAIDDLLELDSEMLERRWREHCADVGQSVDLLHGGQRYRGVITEILPGGALQVELSSGTRKEFEAATTTRLWG